MQKNFSLAAYSSIINMTFLNTSHYYENLTINQPQLMCYAEESDCQTTIKEPKGCSPRGVVGQLSVELGPIIAVLQNVYPTRTAYSGEE
jgi:hypothetical protein